MLANFYIENFSYQENLLTKYHKNSNFDVKIVASMFTFDKNGDGTYITDWNNHLNEHNIPLVRLKNRKTVFAKKLGQFIGLTTEIDVFAPDIIFVHGIQFTDMLKVIKYKQKHPEIKVFVDNHADFNNSARNLLSKYFLHKIIWRRIAKKSIKHVEKFYGVTPARVDFLTNVYQLPKDKVELLPLGADDELIEKVLNPAVRNEKRREYNLSDEEFVIITGGKIDHNKPQIISFMQSINNSGFSNIKLLVFGSVTEELKDKFDAQLSSKVVYIGWKKSEDIYFEFAAADLVVFPGLHSVLWEQAVGMGKPCIFKDIKGFHHIDLGGNCLFFEKDDLEEYILKVREAMDNIDKMKLVAEQKGIKTFSYSEIAKRSIGLK